MRHSLCTLAVSLVGDAVQGALACIATSSEAADAHSPVAVSVPPPASVKRSSVKREAFAELVQTLASAVDQAADAVKADGDQEEEAPHPPAILLVVRRPRAAARSPG